MQAHRLSSLLATAIMLIGGASAFAQTTQPATGAGAWQQAVALLAERIVGSEVAPLATVLNPPPIIRSFTSDALQTPERLISITGAAKVLGVHAYMQLPTTLASDLASDFKKAADLVPETARVEMIPVDESTERRANETSAQWLGSVLQPARDQAVGVIVLWPDAHRLAVTGPVRRAMFVLVKAQFVNGRYIPVQIIVGDPLESPR